MSTIKLNAIFGSVAMTTLVIVAVLQVMPVSALSGVAA